MNLKTLVIIIISFSFFAFMDQPNFRRGIFLAHSTGTTIWGPNGSSTSVPDEIDKYNLQHNFSTDSSFNIIKEDFPLNPWQNEWERWHRIFNNEDTAAVIEPYFNSYEIIIIKSCFPSSALDSRGSSADTLDPTSKTIYNYKWHWRNIIRKMELHPANFFVIWTNAPLVAGQTNDNSALLSDSFCYWAKDTLAKGLDAEYGKFPVNVYVFDFFHKLAGANGKLPLKYAVSNDDSHPNSDATALVAPQLVKEVLDAAAAYESKISGIADGNNITVRDYSLKQNYPNPFNPSTVIKYAIPIESNVNIKFYNSLGQCIRDVNIGDRQPGNYELNFNSSGLASGVYFYSIKAIPKDGGNDFSAVKKMILLK